LIKDKSLEKVVSKKFKKESQGKLNVLRSNSARRSIIIFRGVNEEKAFDKSTT
jgi:hypothetical protein